MKRVAFVSGLQLFPALSGGQLRSTGLAKALVHHGFEVSIYSLIGRSPEYRARKTSELIAHGPHLSEYIDRKPAKAAIQFASYRLDVPPIWISEYLRFRVPAPLAERLEAADAVIADFPFLARVFAKTHKPKVLNTHNIEQHLLPGGGMHALIRARVKQLEDEAAREADVVCCCAQGDADYFRGAGSREVMMVPNGIDVTRFEAARPQRDEMRQKLGLAASETLLLFPASKWGANKQAYRLAGALHRGPPGGGREAQAQVLRSGQRGAAPGRPRPAQGHGASGVRRAVLRRRRLRAQPHVLGRGHQREDGRLHRRAAADSHHRFWRARLRVGQRQERLVL
jgi:hypothetical protein